MNARYLPTALLICLLCGAGASGQSSARSDAADLGAAIAAARTAETARRPAPEARDLSQAYTLTSGAPLWMDDAGRPTAQARAAVALLEQAAAEGLDPDDYAVAALIGMAGALAGPAAAPVRAAAEFDVLLTASVLRYFRHLHLGRLDPRTLGLQIVAPDDGHDFAVSLRSALDGNHLAETASELSPPLAQYRALKAALVRYRALAATPIERPVFAATVRPGEPFADLGRLHHVLTVTGDLPAGTTVPAVYDDVLANAVGRFQERHGLDPDRVIGRATQAALAVPLSWRVRQIELALERLRWLPDISKGRLIAVNIPMFRLFAWDRVPSVAPPVLTMSVIVGRALGTRTPVFADRMEYVIFRPYWNVPRSILVNEILPHMRRDPGYLARENLEIVQGQADASPILAPTAEHIAELGRGDVRVRQRPGAANALGLIKFMFPNHNNVYMHDTPAPYLFQHSRRDFSHGCIRVENPVALAEWAMGTDPAWTRDAIRAAMNGAPNRRVDLPEPIQVIIFYTTAVVLPEDDRVHFAEDIYKQDVRLDQAL
jgi:murein L,D-transpeptidase YcbB/YkuD